MVCFLWFLQCLSDKHVVCGDDGIEGGGHMSFQGHLICGCHTYQRPQHVS